MPSPASAPSMAYTNSPPPLQGPSGQIPGLPLPWQHQLTRPLLWGFPQGPCPGRRQKGLPPLGTRESGEGWGGGQAQLVSHLFSKQENGEAYRTASKWFCVEAQSGMDRGDHLGRGHGATEKASSSLITPIGKPWTKTFWNDRWRKILQDPSHPVSPGNLSWHPETGGSSTC